MPLEAPRSRPSGFYCPSPKSSKHYSASSQLRRSSSCDQANDCSAPEPTGSTKFPADLSVVMLANVVAAIFLLAGLSVIAEDPADKVAFQLLTRGSSQLPDELDVDLTSLDRTKPTILIIHGLGGSSKAKYSVIIRDALLSSRDWNVVVADWGFLAKSEDGYDVAAKNTLPVGKAVSRFARKLLELNGANLTLVGFGLGAHVAGIAAAHMPSHKLHRIIALDATGTLYEKKEARDRLDASDADFVMAIHTCGDFYGTGSRVGHVDFYPNGGRSPQPPCVEEERKHECSHYMAPLLFAESVYNPTAFQATKCGSWSDYSSGRCQQHETVYMGLDTPSTARGEYFLRTEATPPYGDRSSGRYMALATPQELVRSDETLLEDVYDVDEEASGQRQQGAQDTSGASVVLTSIFLSCAAVILSRL